MASPLVSIIIPVYNRASIIKATVESIIKQNYVNWECLIIDDGSTDNTEETINTYVKTDVRFKYYKRPKTITKGANGCRNYGFTLAKGTYVNWFDSDDIMLPNFIAQKQILFKPNTDAVLHKNQYSNHQLEVLREAKFKYNKAESLFYHYAFETIEIQTCGFMWRRNYLVDKNLFNTAITRYQDNEFHIRMLAQNPKIVITNTILATIRGGNGHESQISATVNLTKQKLYDIFYFRYQTLKLSKASVYSQNRMFNQVLSKKMLWAFYNFLRLEPQISVRFTDVITNIYKLKLVFKQQDISKANKLKAITYIIKLVLLK